MVTPVAMEPLLGYHPCSIGFLTSRRDPAVGQCQAGDVYKRQVMAFTGIRLFHH